MKKSIYICLSFLYIGCAVPAKLVESKKNETVKFDPLPESRIESVKLEYMLPVITPIDNTEQIQTKGGITVSCAIQPVEVVEKSFVEEHPSVVEPDAYVQHTHDRIEKVTLPVISTSPNRVIFTIKIRNNSGKILRLSSIGLALLQDQKLYDLPKESKEEWGMGMILNGFEKEYMIPGPQLESIGDQVLYGIILQDIPTMYDSAGMVRKVESFEWFYELKLNKQYTERNKQYEYYTARVKSEQCSGCNGVGSNLSQVNCPSCGGTGRTYNILNGKYYVCSRCQGAKIVTMNVPCKVERCEKGNIFYPVSSSARITSRHTEYLSVYAIYIISNTASCGIDVFKVEGEEGRYEYVGQTPMQVRYEISKEHNQPMVINYNGGRYNVYPIMNEKGVYPGVIRLRSTNGALTAKGARIEKI